MSKLREWEDPGQKDGKQKESWADAAARAAGEWIAETFYLEPQARFALIEIQQSDRDEKWKQYHFQVFQIDAQRDTKLSPGARIEWLSPDDILDPNRRPISDTARMLVQRIIDMIQEAKRL
jgi:hypothetical protein